MIDRNHPAVEALADAIYWALSGQYGDFGTPSKGEAHAALNAAREHYTADDLRSTPAGRELMAEAWDQATLWIDSYQGGPNGRTTSARSANPYRPAQEPPTERDGVVLVPADLHESITTTDGQEFSRLTFTTKKSIWYGPNLAARLGDLVIQTTVADRLTPGTWKVADQ